MKVMEAINTIDRLKPNTYDTRQKLRWLTALDGILTRQLLEQFDPGVQCPVYDLQLDDDWELLAPAPYDEMYLLWLEGRMDYYNGDYIRSNNAMAMFQTVYRAYCDAYIRTHRNDAGGFR